MCIFNLFSDMQSVNVHFQLVLIDRYLVQSACVDQAVVCQSDHVAVVPAHAVFVSVFVFLHTVFVFVFGFARTTVFIFEQQMFKINGYLSSSNLKY